MGKTDIDSKILRDDIIQAMIGNGESSKSLQQKMDKFHFNVGGDKNKEILWLSTNYKLAVLNPSDSKNRMKNVRTKDYFESAKKILDVDNILEFVRKTPDKDLNFSEYATFILKKYNRNFTFTDTENKNFRMKIQAHYIDNDLRGFAPDRDFGGEKWLLEKQILKIGNALEENVKRQIAGSQIKGLPKLIMNSDRFASFKTKISTNIDEQLKKMNLESFNELDEKRFMAIAQKIIERSIPEHLMLSEAQKKEMDASLKEKFKEVQKVQKQNKTLNQDQFEIFENQLIKKVRKDLNELKTKDENAFNNLTEEQFYYATRVTINKLLQNNLLSDNHQEKINKFMKEEFKEVQKVQKQNIQKKQDKSIEELKSLIDDVLAPSKNNNNIAMENIRNTNTEKKDKANLDIDALIKNTDQFLGAGKEKNINIKIGNVDNISNAKVNISNAKVNISSNNVSHTKTNFVEEHIKASFVKELGKRNGTGLF